DDRAVTGQRIDDLGRTVRRAGADEMRQLEELFVTLVGDERTVAFDHPDMAGRVAPQGEGLFLDHRYGDVVGIAAADFRALDPVERHQPVAGGVHIGAEGRLSQMETQRGENQLRRGALRTDEMDLGDSETRLGGEHTETTFGGVDGAPDHAAGDDRGDHGQRGENQGRDQDRAADADQLQRRFQDAQPERCVAVGPRGLLLGRRGARDGRCRAPRGLRARAGRLGGGAHRSHEASSTIQRTKAPKPYPQKDACSGTNEVGVIPGCVFTSKRISLRFVPESSYRKSARLTPLQPKISCAFSAMRIAFSATSGGTFAGMTWAEPPSAYLAS